MGLTTPGSLLSFLSDIPDPRSRHGQRHPLVAMLAHASCAMLCGCRGSAAIAQWGRDQPIELMHKLGYRRRPPSYGAFQSLFSRLDAKALERALARWIAHVLGESKAAELAGTALDGKTSRGSLGPHDTAVHLLAAMDQRTGCVLSQMRVDSRTNEHKAALELLKNLALKGRVNTGDAMFCQRDPLRQVVADGGHYLWKVDDNQPSLKEAIESAFELASSPLRTASSGGRTGPSPDARRAWRSSRNADT